MANDVAALERQFGIPGKAKVESGNGGLPCVRINTDLCTGEIYLHGAHLTAWQPAGAKPVIWMSGKSWFEPGKPIRGGVPICFPWFGPHESDTTLPAHGFARLVPWQLESVQALDGGEIRVSLRLWADEATRKYWPFEFALRQQVTFGRDLLINFDTKNSGKVPFTVGQALHTYFAVGDIRQVMVMGCEGKSYIDKVDGKKIKTQDGGITFTEETDRVYLDVTGRSDIVDVTLGRRRIVVEKSGSDQTVVWNPWMAKAKAMADFGDEEWPGMVCVETCQVPPEALTLQPAGLHKMSAHIKCESIGARA